MYTTEQEIVAKAKRAFLLKRQAVLAGAAKGRDVKAYDLSVLESPGYRRWIEGLVVRARADRLLLTDQQYADWRAGRMLNEGDRARYVGPARLEPTSTGRMVLRPSGQLGRVIRALKRPSRGIVYTFQPDVDATKLGPEADVDLIQLVTSDWQSLERLP